MAIFILELPETGGETRIDGTKAMLIEADTLAEARTLAAAESHGDANWDDTGVTGPDVTTLSASDYLGWVYRARIRPPTGSGADVVDVSYTAIASDTVNLIGAALRERLKGAAIAAAIADDGGSFTDETTPANESTVDDVNLFPATPVASDAFYMGQASIFERVLLDITTVGTGTYTLDLQYWNGAWTTIPGVVDDTSDFKTTGLNDITFTAPTDWVKNTVNSQGPFFFIRAVGDAGTYTATPLAGQIYMGTGTRASYSTPTLDAAAIADGLGDQVLEVTATAPGALNTYSSAIGAITDEGIAAAVLDVALDIPTAIPIISKKF